MASPTIHRWVCAHACALSLFGVALFSFLSAELILPAIGAGTLNDAVVLDTRAKFDKTLGSVMRAEYELLFFNLTNGHALLTQTPAPKPQFQVRPPRTRAPAARPPAARTGFAARL